MMRKNAYIYSLICITFIWYLAYLLLSVPFVPSPQKVIVYMFNNLRVLGIHSLTSLYRITLAILITVLIGGASGLVIARHATIDRWLSPILYSLYPVPKIAFLPLLMLFFGLGNASKIILVSLILYFQITIAVRDSVKAIHPSYLISIKSLGANTKEVYEHVLIPAILPNIFTALRISVGTSISVLFFAENFATTYGIGYFIMDSWLKLDYTGMFAGIVAIGLMGSGLFLILDYLEHLICP